MAKRYFVNQLSDFTGTLLEMPKADIKNLCQLYTEKIFSKQSIQRDECNGGLYTGAAGVGYMCYFLSQHPEFASEKKFLEKSLYYMKPALHFAMYPEKHEKDMQLAFILGGIGTLAVGAALMKTLGDDEEMQEYLNQYNALAEECIDRDYLGCGSDELLVGRAGYLCGVLFLEKVFGEKVVSDEIAIKLCIATVEAGRKYSKKRKSPCPLMYAYYDTEYLGAAHGLSGILQILLNFPALYKKIPKALDWVKESVDYILNLQTPSGNFPCATDEVTDPRPESDELVHWCHGAPGVIYLMAAAYLKWKREEYLASCLAAGEVVWNKGLLKKGPGLCHGIAGNGYVFLLLYRLTGDKKHLHRAHQFAKFLTSEEFKKAKIPDKPYSLFEGIAGTVCFLADLMQPDKAHFPLFDVFQVAH
ncbi:lanC-like protein 3 homolog [Caerostris extrusa]|uniref:LanC-like protein 3 homolog n=1 Tax=Caerostris extrusa TaxID=172846 RepID=A0AAV4X1B2_CAEEX|nr:lanC-like protein 3 homolog [Caerostris extrusa]